MKGPMRRYCTVGFSLIGVSIVVGVAIAVFRLSVIGPAQTAWIVALVAAGILAVMGLWILFGILDSHFDDLERLRAGVLVAAMTPDGRLPVPRVETQEGEVARLREAVETLLARRLFQPVKPDDRLEAVLATLDEGIVVITETGQISLVNAPAKAMLGPERVALGTSVFAALERDLLLAGWEAARKAGGVVDWTLEDVDGHRYGAKVADLQGHSGAVVRLAMEEGRHRRAVEVQARAQHLEHDLSLHDAVPEVNMEEDTPLADLPVLVFDSETTGLDVAKDRMVSLGGVRVHGARIFHMANVDRLINPGVPIPPRSIAVHGITDDVVADAPPFARVWPSLEPLMRGAVVVGHNIGFDIAMLRRECAIAGIAWHDPPTLDTLLLAGMLFPDMNDLNLESLCERLGVDVHGRHTALGDALVTAEVYVRLLPLLEAEGVTTYAQARAFAARADHLRARQKAMGW